MKVPLISVNSITARIFKYRIRCGYRSIIHMEPEPITLIPFDSKESTKFGTAIHCNSLKAFFALIPLAKIRQAIHHPKIYPDIYKHRLIEVFIIIKIKLSCCAVESEQEYYHPPFHSSLFMN